MDSVRIEDLIRAMPKVDSLMPMLSSFEGTVSSRMAAELQLNSNLSVNLPSIHAGLKLQGQNLVLLDGETFSEIAHKHTANIAGIHNLDGNFNYRIDLRHPTPLGLNVFGENMDKIKFKLGQPEIINAATGESIKIKKKDKHAALENDVNAIAHLLERIRTFILNVSQKK